MRLRFKSAKVVAANVLVYFLAAIYVLPILWTVLSSFKSEADLFAYPPKLLTEPTLENYKEVMSSSEILTFFKNSAIVAISSSAITVVVSIMGGYALAKYEFRLKRTVSTLILSTLMIPLQVIMVAVYMVLAKLNMLNTYWGLIIPPAATPTGIFLSQKYLVSTIPDSVIESARIDGAGEMTVFWKIIFPLSQPLIAALAVLSFTWRWNDFLWPLIVVSSPKLYTVQLALGMYAGEHIVQWGPLLAMTVLSMLPVLIVFVALQKYFVKGIATGAIK